MVSCEDRILVTLVHTVSFDSLVLSGNEGLVLSLKPLKSLFKSHNLVIYLMNNIFSIDANALKSSTESWPG